MSSSTPTIDPNITMRELLEQFPAAQRALFRKYHIGGCSNCGFSPDETLAALCTRNDNLDVDEVLEHIMTSEAADRALQIEPRELADRISRRKSLSSRCAHARRIRRGQNRQRPSIHTGNDARDLKQ